MGLLDFFSQKQHLQFNALELSAIVKLAKVMAAADGHLDVKELTVIANEAKRFGIPNDDFDMILTTSDAMEASDSIMIQMICLMHLPKWEMMRKMKTVCLLIKI